MATSLKWASHYRDRLAESQSPQALRAAVLCQIARSLCSALELDSSRHEESRLFQLANRELVDDELAALLRLWVDSELQLFSQTPEERHLEAAHRLGEALDTLLAHEKSGERRKLGSYYTPVRVARSLIERSVEQAGDRFGPHPRICDPACGGGAFLLEAAASQSRTSPKEAWRESRAEAVRGVFGVDASALAVAVAEFSLWIFVGDGRASLLPTERFHCADALMAFSYAQAKEGKKSGLPAYFSFEDHFPAVFSGDTPGFDWIVGNPPWVAFQGRATQKITPELRAYYRAHYRAFRGYPTLHGLFVERATRIAPRGVLSLLLPSSVSDLTGYQATRETVELAHEVLEPLEEYGQDAFESVVQPCFGLVARHRLSEVPPPTRSAWTLKERARSDSKDLALAPEFLKRWDQSEFLPAQTFKEMGFQSNRVISAQLFLRASSGRAEYSVPLLEGRNVGEFSQRSPGLFLKPDSEVLAENRCRLRAQEDYAKVEFVVRQTAAFTIAAQHQGARFRNSLIAGYGQPGLSADLLVGLLNSALFRALHLSRQRDARQATFPQVKLQHLRKLPRPPEDLQLRRKIESISAQAQVSSGLTLTQREELDGATFQLFGVSAAEAEEVRLYLESVAPRAIAASLKA